MAVAESAPRKSDLAPRVASAVVMLLLVGIDIWLGGWAFTAFVVLIAAGVYWEWWGLARHLAAGPASLLAWMTGGVLYIGVAAVSLIALRAEGLGIAVMVLAMVIAVDIGAYFAGRGIGGPKIAPSISPSKTWAGLGGGILGATAIHLALLPWVSDETGPRDLSHDLTVSFAAGALTAVVAQAGDFFESWMKRRAGRKDSGRLIPGHGGLFDRVDGLLAVLVLFAAMRAAG